MSMSKPPFACLDRGSWAVRQRTMLPTFRGVAHRVWSPGASDTELADPRTHAERPLDRDGPGRALLPRGCIDFGWLEQRHIRKRGGYRGALGKQVLSDVYEGRIWALPTGSDYSLIARLSARSIRLAELVERVLGACAAS